MKRHFLSLTVAITLMPFAVKAQAVFSGVDMYELQAGRFFVSGKIKEAEDELV
ncbi:hypothetical protein GWO43_04240 [candidate division KSB1 bacterium]|nr:hypothetical protein [candidate division KSB1 bacterium]NIR70515.1 hypothetical protein [candidate division KSB1 bacterium]NIS24514.1 hypothetical protein [candidate division KSB1 bacterium]NIT70109.1 hypothetical protein [candidate division KSB1 bacterium]NIU23764.1 hypothetical protein [candidate division KSB1 bacterium]